MNRPPPTKVPNIPVEPEEINLPGDLHLLAAIPALGMLALIIFMALGKF